MRVQPESARGRGFSLIELLIALAVVALILSAATGAAGLAIRNQTALQDQTQAHWVASNVLAEYRLSEEWPDIDEEDGETQLAGRSWRWRATVGGTQVGELRRVDVEVWLEDMRDDSDPIVRLSGFVGQQRARALVGLWSQEDAVAPPEQSGEAP